MTTTPNAPPSRSSPCTVIRNAHVLTLDDADREWPQADIVLRDGRIEALGPGVARGDLGPVQREVDGSGLLAMPGLVNAHFHSPGNLMKGFLPGHPLEVFMLHEVPPLADAGDGGRLVYLRTLLGAMEMLRRGVTAVQDDAYHVPVATEENLDAIMRAYRDAGLRATVAIDQPNVVEHDKLPFLRELLPPQALQAMEAAPRQGSDELLQLYAHLVERWHGSSNGRLRAAVSCSALQRVTPDYAQALSALSRARDLPFYVHVLETRLQRVLGDVKYGHSLVRELHARGLLDERMMVIHAIWVDDEDIALMGRAGCTVAHNPVCNLRLGSGVMPWRALHDAGVPVCLGSDEMNTDDSVNLWFVAKTAALIHSLATPDDARWAQPAEVLRALTRGGARAMRQGHELGMLAPGALADLILLDLDTVAFFPLHDLRRQLVHCEDGQSLRMSFVDGELVYDHGRLTTVDERAVKAEIREHLGRVKAQLAQGAHEAARLEPYYRAMLARSLEHPVKMRRHLYGD